MCQGYGRVLESGKIVHSGGIKFSLSILLIMNILTLYLKKSLEEHLSVQKKVLLLQSQLTERLVKKSSGERQECSFCFVEKKINGSKKAFRPK